MARHPSNDGMRPEPKTGTVAGSRTDAISQSSDRGHSDRQPYSAVSAFDRVDAPGIAGRSPSYLVRQLYDLQRGTRKDKSSPLMQPVVANLTIEDMVTIAPYVTSRVPPATSTQR